MTKQFEKIVSEELRQNSGEFGIFQVKVSQTYRLPPIPWGTLLADLSCGFAAMARRKSCVR